MLLGAFLGLGFPLEVLEAGLSALPMEGWKLGQRTVNKKGLEATQFLITVNDSETHRGLRQIRQILETSSLDKRVQERSLAVFERLAEAEASVHGMSVEEVHFHEVGALDALVDVVGFCLGLEYLQIEKIYCGSFPIGEGEVWCEHGRIPNPAPATHLLLRGWPLRSVTCQKELVTPTGAALLTCLGQSGRPLGEFTFQDTAFGAGTRELEFANVVRVSLGEESLPREGLSWRVLTELECHIDDDNPEVLGYTMEKLFEAGALDVSFEAVSMKKNRLGQKLWVLCEPAKSELLARLILTETTSIGLRRCRVERAALSREFLDVTTEWGVVKVKRVTDPRGETRCSPEFESAKALAEKRGVPLRSIYNACTEACAKIGE